MSDLRDHSQPCDHVTDPDDFLPDAARFGAQEVRPGLWVCSYGDCPGGWEVTDEDILAMAAALEPFQCGGCDEWISVSHWRSGADGVMFHAGSDAPPSDPSPVANLDGATDE